MMQQYSYRQKGSDLGLWDAGLGRTIAGPACKVLDDLKDHFYLSPVQQVPTESNLAAAYTSMRLYDSPENWRFIAPYEEAMQQPALRGFMEQLQATVPGAAVRNARVQHQTRPRRCTKLHTAPKG